MQLYRARNPKKSPLWQCLNRHYDQFETIYPETYQPRYGPLRPIIPEVIHKFMDCGNLERGFARIRCDECQHEYLLAFSCKSRWFCPSCHQRKIQTTAQFITAHVLAPVPHCHYVLSIPKMLRPFFRHHRNLLKNLCALARESLTDYLRTALDLPEGIPGIILSIHTFGEYLDFHPHLHAMVADGLFRREPTPIEPPASDNPSIPHATIAFHLLPPTPVKFLEELFRAKVIRFLEDQKLLPPDRARALRSWVHSGFNVHAGHRVKPEHTAELNELAQYILRNPFALEKIILESPTGNVIYRSRMNAKINRNFEVFTATDFLAAITQHIPDKGVQMVRYYGWYSNKMRGCRSPDPSANATHKPRRPNIIPPPPKRLPSKKWRDLIQQVWHTDPLHCPVCQNVMRVIAIIDNRQVVEKILRHLGLWTDPAVYDARPPPTGSGPYTYEQCPEFNPMPDYENVLTD